MHSSIFFNDVYHSGVCFYLRAQARMMIEKKRKALPEKLTNWKFYMIRQLKINEQYIERKARQPFRDKTVNGFNLLCKVSYHSQPELFESVVILLNNMFTLHHLPIGTRENENSKLLQNELT